MNFTTANKLFQMLPLLDADKGGGEGGQPNQEKSSDPPENGSGEDFETWLGAQPAEVKAKYEAHTKALKTALDAERESRKAIEKKERELAKQQEEAEQKRLEEEKAWEKLAEDRKAKLTEAESKLQALQEKLEKAEKALKAQVDQLRKNLPKHIITLLDRLELADQLEYIAANSEELLKKKAPGLPETPNPGGSGELSDEQKQEARSQAASLYNL